MEENLGEKYPRLTKRTTWETADYFGVDGKDYTNSLFKVTLGDPNIEATKRECEDAKKEFSDRTKFSNQKLATLFKESSEKDWKTRRGYYRALFKEMRERDAEDNSRKVK